MTVEEVISKFGSLSALVVGDLCLDRWCTYDPALADVSRETGIPRTAVVATEVSPGAAGTVASNLITLGAGRVAVAGVIGVDGFGYELKRTLHYRDIDPSLVVETPLVQTFTYTKLLRAGAAIEDLPRVDFINNQPMPAAVEAQVLERISLFVPDFDVIFISDQSEIAAGGVITAPVRDLLCQFASMHPAKIFWVDSRMRPELFRDVILKPNAEEAEQASRRMFGVSDLTRLRNAIGSRPMFVTCGGHGVMLIDDSGQRVIPARNQPNPVDICGAGDSFSAAAGLALAATSDPVEAARFGNWAASVTIMKKGTGTVNAAELLAASQA